MFRSIRHILAAVGFCVAASLSATPQAEEIDVTSKEQIEEIVRNYILENPEIIAEAVSILQDRADRQAHEDTLAALHRNRALLEDDPLSIVAGNPEGDVTLVEFYDYRCPYCRQIHKDVMQLLEEDKNLKVVFKQFPVKDRPGETPVSLISARIAMAAEEQGLFLPFHDAMYEAEPPLSEARVYQIARDVGIDLERALQDMRDPEITRHLRETLVLANEIGATGTPTLVVGDIMIPGAVELDVLKEVIAYTREAKMAEADKMDPGS